MTVHDDAESGTELLQWHLDAAKAEIARLRARAEKAEAIVAAARAVVDEAVALREMHQISNRVPVPSGQFRLLLEVLSSALEDNDE